MTGNGHYTGLLVTSIVRDDSASARHPARVYDHVLEAGRGKTEAEVKELLGAGVAVNVRHRDH
jgi:hypothetical protein